MEGSIKVGELAGVACEELFAAYGVTLTRDSAGFTPTDERLYSSVIGFLGPTLRGTCLLAGTEPALMACCPPDGHLRDWAGELANQLAGRLKVKLLARGIEVYLATPSVLTGIRLEPLPRVAATPHLFRTELGPVLVWVEIDAGSDFRVGSERPLQVTEGEVLLF